MYQDNVQKILPVSAAAGLGALPATGDNQLFQFAAIAAIAIGVAALILQLGVSIYRFANRKK